MIRVGHGYDAHRFEAGRPLVIGGVTIPHAQGLAAHSDGDVLIHALCDALLGAVGEGDIGRHFPDSSAEFSGIDSRILLRRVIERLQTLDWRVGNVDVTVIAQVPRMGPHIAAMVTKLAEDLQVDEAQVNVKATTTERMGFAGREEGIEVHAVALLEVE
jgi:2-C-methyl-D-erythritol 2,4-cyclodiphosphate synthase